MTRRIAILIVAVWCILWGPAANAIYTPNPAARWAPNRFFLAGDFQFNGNKDLDNGPELENNVGLFIRPSYSILRNFVIYGRLGFEQSDVSGNGPSVDAGFAIGFGLQYAYVLPAAPEWAIGGSFDYVYWDGDQGNHNINWNEFQFAPAASFHPSSLPILTPYAGLMFDFVDARDSVSESDPVGMLFGTNIDPTPNVRLDVQFRVISENGLFFSAGYLF